MKTEVYSWRVSSRRKSELEEEARRNGTSLAELLEQISGAWLDTQTKLGTKNASSSASGSPLPPPSEASPAVIDTVPGMSAGSC